MSNVHESSKDRFHVVFPWLYKTYFGGMQSLFLIVPIMNWEGILFSTILFLNPNPGTRKVHYTKMLQKKDTFESVFIRDSYCIKKSTKGFSTSGS